MIRKVARLKGKREAYLSPFPINLSKNDLNRDHREGEIPKAFEVKPQGKCFRSQRRISYSAPALLMTTFKPNDFKKVESPIKRAQSPVKKKTSVLSETNVVIVKSGIRLNGLRGKTGNGFVIKKKQGASKPNVSIDGTKMVEHKDAEVKLASSVTEVLEPTTEGLGDLVMKPGEECDVDDTGYISDGNKTFIIDRKDINNRYSYTETNLNSKKNSNKKLLESNFSVRKLKPSTHFPLDKQKLLSKQRPQVCQISKQQHLQRYLTQQQQQHEKQQQVFKLNSCSTDSLERGGSSVSFASCRSPKLPSIRPAIKKNSVNSSTLKIPAVITKQKIKLNENPSSIICQRKTNTKKQPVEDPELRCSSKAVAAAREIPKSEGVKQKQIAPAAKKKDGAKIGPVKKKGILPFRPCLIDSVSVCSQKSIRPNEVEMWTKFEELFKSYARTKRYSGELIPHNISTTWMRNTGVVGGILTHEDATQAFKKAAGPKIAMNVKEYKEFLISLTIKKKLPFYEIYRRMCGM